MVVIQKKVLKWEYKINFFMVLVIFACLLIATFFINSYVESSVEKEMINNLKNVGYIVAYDTKINDALKGGDVSTDEINAIATRIKDNADGVEYIIVIDMDGTIYAHPDPEMIGQTYQDVAEEDAYDRMPHYYSSIGDKQNTVKYFTPTMSDGKQLGVVITGTYANNIRSTLSSINRVITLFVILGLAIGTAIAIGLFGLESKEYAEILDQRSAILMSIKDGIIAVNQEGQINTINASAKKLLGVTDRDLNRYIEDVLPDSNLQNTLATSEGEYDMELNYNGHVLITNCIPVKSDENTIIGAVATFQDKTEMVMLTRELTGIQSIVDSLRAYSHEFMNRLHVILGLIQLESYDEAKKYILQVTKQQQQTLSNVMKKIQDTTTAALVLGKASRSKEMGVEFTLDEESHLGSVVGILSDEFIVVVIGNLIDNALEATEIIEDDREKRVTLLLTEDDDAITIVVSDTGVGISEEMKEKIFVKGVSTKSTNNLKPSARGIGLATVKKHILRVGGSVQIDSTVGVGSKFTVIIPKKGREKK